VRVLVACEFSGVVRDAFIARGHDAMSCDLLDTERPGPHYKGDVRDVWDACWDLMIAHPDCTHLAVSGARHFDRKRLDGRQAKGIAFFMQLTRTPVPRWAIENPVCIMSRLYRRPDQIIQPWQYGHGETKATCLWLNGLPPLQPTSVVDGRANRIHTMAPSPDRWRERSRTYQGIADAMANQWGSHEDAAGTMERDQSRSDDRADRRYRQGRAVVGNRAGLVVGNDGSPQAACG
jgi:hypothetical protein